MNQPLRRPRPSDVRAAWLAPGLVLLGGWAVGVYHAAQQDYAGHLFWRALANAVAAMAPWAAAAAGLALVQFAVLVLILGHRRRAALALGSGYVMTAMLAAQLPTLTLRIAERIPPEKLPLFAKDPVSMAAFLRRIAESFLLPDRLWDAFTSFPTLWAVALVVPVVLGLVLFPASFFLLRQWSARAGSVHTRLWLGWTLALVVLAAAPWAGERLTRPATAGLPDIVLISVDTLRRDAVGAYVGPTVTPHLDALARRGVRLDDLRAPSSWTLPSHAALLTGRTPWSLGISRVVDSLAPGALTLAEHLAAAGYDTQSVVAHLFVDAPYGFGQGFDRIAHPRSESADAVVNKGRDWLADRPSDRAAFLFLHFYDPHWPYRPPADAPPELLAHTTAADRAEVDRHDDAFVFVDALRDGPPSLTETAIALYRAEVWATDRELGRLFKAIERSGRPTIIAVVSDHGEMFGEHDMYGHGLTLFEPEIRVPGLLVGPGLPIGRMITGPVGLIDIAPTLVALAGVDTPLPGGEGRDIAAELRAGQGLPRRFVAGENHSLTTEPVRYLCDGKWKWRSAVRDRIKSAVVDYPEAWHDLSVDPNERTALVAAENLPPLGELLARFFAGKDAAATPRVELSPAERDRLRSLGYLP